MFMLMRAKDVHFHAKLNIRDRARENENYIVYSTDTPEDYWCQVPELENITSVAYRKFLSIPLIEVRESAECG